MNRFDDVVANPVAVAPPVVRLSVDLFVVPASPDDLSNNRVGSSSGRLASFETILSAGNNNLCFF